MIEQGRKRRFTAILVSGVAIAAVAGVAVAGTALARSRDSSTDTAAAGGWPASQTPAPTPTDTAAEPPSQAPPTPGRPPANTPSPSQAPPTSRVPSVAPPPETPRQTPCEPVTQTPMPPTRSGKCAAPTPTVQPPPADPVAACKSWLKDLDVAKPGRGAKPVARVDGAPGTVLILADSKYWAGCDTAYARGGDGGSIRRPDAVTGVAPGDAAAFTVANNVIPINGKLYEYYWSAGRVPAGVSKISYAFPDGRTTNAVVQGKYWIMQHRAPAPVKDGDPAPTTLIKVTLYGANGHAFRDFLLVWGEDTCAQMSHGC
ncbi:hypothetical protein AB0E69_13350 [Kribbella sp. NPDC026611]|uniref:hypothetical protein n=1 Tax=Kribbella sp. NPDC026611 TaxID=3154911 RepID=UPI00340BF32E